MKEWSVFSLQVFFDEYELEKVRNAPYLHLFNTKILDYLMIHNQSTSSTNCQFFSD